MHLKNFSVISGGGGNRSETISLSPAYDLLNSTLVLEKAVEETALPLKGKKKNLTRELGLDYFCTERLGLPDGQVDTILADLEKALPEWRDLIGRSHLPPTKKEAYQDLLDERSRRLGIGPKNS